MVVDRLVGPCPRALESITAAGLRADHLGHLGAARAVTPTLDRLAEQGVSFPVCYATSNQDVASAAALLTGNCPAGTDVHQAGEIMREGQLTLAERFADSGFHTTAVVSNPALLDAGLDQGFEEFQRRRASAPTCRPTTCPTSTSARAAGASASCSG
jgi:arylsulfatase